MEKKTKDKDFIVEEIPEEEIESEIIYDRSVEKKRSWKPAVFLVVALLVVSSLVWFFYPGKSSSPVAAFVNGYAIYNSDIDKKYDALPAVYKQMVSRGDLINRTVDEVLIKEEIKRSGVGISKEEVDGAFKKLLRQSMISSEQFDEYLKNNNTSKEDALKSVEDSLLISKFVNETMPVSVSAAEIQSYYDGNKELFFQPESRNVSHILVCYAGTEGCSNNRSKDEAVSLINSLLKRSAKEDFGKLAYEYSDCPSAKNNGNLGLINSDSPFVEEFKNAVLKLGSGEISGVVETEFGMHIIKVISVIPEKAIPLQDVKSQISSELRRQKTSAEISALIARLRANASIVLVGSCDGVFFYTAGWCAPCAETEKIVDELVSGGAAIKKVVVAENDAVKVCFKDEMKNDIPQILCRGASKTGSMTKEEIVKFVEKCK